MATEPKLNVVPPSDEPPMTIQKPAGSSLDRFKSKKAVNGEGVGTLLTALPHYKISEAKDFVRLHPDEENYWSWELCFVAVPIQGQKRDTLHFIDEDIATMYLPPARVQRFRLALASKPWGVFFLCHVPSLNLDNSYNESSLRGCHQAKTLWVQASSQADKGIESYLIQPARDQDAFPAPNWPTQSLGQLVDVTFAGRMIDRADHPALLRLVGARQVLS